MVFAREAMAQCSAPTRVYADAQSYGSSSALVASASVDNPTAAVGANLSTNATALNVVTVLGAAEAWTQLKFTNAGNPSLPLPAGTTTYVKIGGESAGALLGLIGGSSLPVYAYSGATPTSDGTQIATNNVSVTNLTTLDGTIYLAITPNTAYNAVRIALNASVLIGTGRLLIYHAFYQTSGASCDPTLGASTSIAGLLNLGGNINNPLNAIDGNLSTYSTFSMGLVGAGTTLKERVYFPGPSNDGDAATITFSIPSSLLLDLSLLNNISITPYNGSIAGTPINLSSLLSLDLLSLLRANNIVTVSFVPPTKFDRIEISMGSLVSLLAQMNLYEVQRTPAKPSFIAPSASSVTICYGKSATLSSTTGSCNELHWYTSASGGTATIGPTYTTGNLTTTTTYYVAAAKIGCAAESERVPVVVTVNPLPTAVISGTASVCINATAPSITFTGTGSVAPYTFTYKIGNGTNQTILSNAAGVAIISVPTSVTGTFIYSLISVSDSSTTACAQQQNGFASVTVLPKPNAPPMTANTY